MHAPEDDAPGNLPSSTNSHTAAQLVITTAHMRQACFATAGYRMGCGSPGPESFYVIPYT
jgi:hypothetical protein